MIVKKNIKKILALIGAGALIGATLGGCATSAPAPQITQEQIDGYKDLGRTEGFNDGYDSGFSEGEENVDATAIRQAGIDSVDITSDNDQAIKDFNAKVAKDVTAVATDAQAKIDEEDKDGYNLDELEIGAEYSYEITDRQLASLTDDEVTFDGDEFSVDEILTLTKFIVANNYEDEYKADTYLQILDLTYTVEFGNGLNTSLIGDKASGNEDETLTFDFLGNEYEVSGWNGGTVTFTQGTKVPLTEGAMTEVDGNKITLVVAGDDYVSVNVNGLSKKIFEGDTKEINGVEVEATDIIGSESWRLGGATLKIGEDVLFEVTDGEEYEPDEIYDWVIKENSIGIELTEAFLSIDEDEDFKAFAAGEKFVLPNDYISITYNGLVEEDTEKYKFELDDGFVEAKGDFASGTKSYSRVYIDASGIYDDKDVSDSELNATSIDLGDTGLTLNLTDGALEIDSITLTLALDSINDSNIEIGDTSISSEEEDYLTTYGIVIKGPEDAVEDKDFEIVIPEEELTADITIRAKPKAEAKTE